MSSEMKTKETLVSSTPFRILRSVRFQQEISPILDKSCINSVKKLADNKKKIKKMNLSINNVSNTQKSADITIDEEVPLETANLPLDDIFRSEKKNDLICTEKNESSLNNVNETENDSANGSNNKQLDVPKKKCSFLYTPILPKVKMVFVSSYDETVMNHFTENNQAKNIDVIVVNEVKQIQVSIQTKEDDKPVTKSSNKRKPSSNDTKKNEAKKKITAENLQEDFLLRDSKANIEKNENSSNAKQKINVEETNSSIPISNVRCSSRKRIKPINFWENEAYVKKTNFGSDWTVETVNNTTSSKKLKRISESRTSKELSVKIIDEKTDPNSVPKPGIPTASEHRNLRMGRPSKIHRLIGSSRISKKILEERVVDNTIKNPDSPADKFIESNGNLNSGLSKIRKLNDKSGTSKRLPEKITGGKDDDKSASVEEELLGTQEHDFTTNENNNSLHTSRMSKRLSRSINAEKYESIYESNEKQIVAKESNVATESSSETDNLIDKDGNVAGTHDDLEKRKSKFSTNSHFINKLDDLAHFKTPLDTPDCEQGIHKMIDLIIDSQKVQMECFGSYPKQLKFLQKNNDISVGVIIENKMFMSGLVFIKPSGKKPKEYSKNHFLYFFVLSGTCLVQIHKSKKLMSAGESFFVPHGVPYSVENIDRTLDLKLMYTKYLKGPHVPE